MHLLRSIALFAFHCLHHLPALPCAAPHHLPCLTCCCPALLAAALLPLPPCCPAALPPQVDVARLEAAHHMLGPLCLRRLKAEVELGLPPLVETRILCPLSRMQTFWVSGVVCGSVCWFSGSLPPPTPRCAALRCVPWPRPAAAAVPPPAAQELVAAAPAGEGGG